MYLKYILCFAVISCFGQNPELKKMPWSENTLLTWADFEGKPVYTKESAASTFSGISFQFSISKTENKITAFTAHISSFFYPEKSWYKKEFSNNYLLKHEQFHFNISELHARKFRKKISNLEVSQSIKEQLNGISKAINKASSDMQKKYDAETKHSINREKQLEWEIFITAELNKLDAFKAR